MTLIFDTETSGFSESRLLQLGVLLVDERYEVQMQASLLVRPDGWRVEEGAEKVHGISQEKAGQLGLPVDVVLGIFCGFAIKADVLVGHNLEFDTKILSGELKKAGWPLPLFERSDCTMRMMTPVCKIPPTEKMVKAGRTGWKSPKLMEAYRHAFGEDFVGAHDALADCVATLRVWRWIKSQEKGYVPPPVVHEPVPIYAPPAPLPSNL